MQKKKEVNFEIPSWRTQAAAGVREQPRERRGGAGAEAAAREAEDLRS